jgi:O-antigen/teichoic acid export membrane protein
VLLKYKNKIKNIEGVIRYSKNAAWMLVEKILRIISLIVIGVLLARYLEPKTFGVYSNVISIYAIFSGIVKLGLDGILVRELIKYPNKINNLLGTAFWLKIISGLFAIVFILLVLTKHTSNNQHILLAVVSVGLIFQAFEVIDIYYQSQVQVKISTICKVTQSALSAVLKVTLLTNSADLIWFLFAYVLDVAVLAALYVVSYANNLHRRFFKIFDLSLAKSLIISSWPLMISSIAVMIYMKIDIIMVNDMLGPEEAGIYSVAVRISEGFYFLPVAITASIFPAIINSRAQDLDLYRKRIHRLYMFLAWLAILITLPVVILSEELVVSLFGEPYISAGNVLKIHAWSTIFVFLGVGASKWVIAEGLTRNAALRTVLGAAMNVVLNYLFINAIGMEGAALSTLISYSFVNFFSLALFKKTRVCFFQQVRALNVFKII